MTHGLSAPRLTWRQRADFAALSAWLLASGGMAVTAWAFFGVDFRGYYAAARVVLRGGNPYDYSQVAPVLLAVTGRLGNNPYYYPPWLAIALAPLAALPWTWARGLWLLLNWALWLVGLTGLARLLDWPAPGWRRWLFSLLATYLFAWITWRYEQLGGLLFVALVGVLWALRSGRDGWAGVGLALLLTKPNASGVVVAALLAWLIRQRRWRGVGAWAATLTGLLAVSTALIPRWYQFPSQPDFGRGLTDELDGPGRVVAARINTTLLDWLAGFGLPAPAQLALYGVVAVIGLALLVVVIWRAPAPVEMVSLAAVIGFLVTPYALQYDFPMLTVTLFCLGRATARAAGWARMVGAAVLIFVASVPLWERPISDGFWIVLGLGALAAWRALGPASLWEAA